MKSKRRVAVPTRPRMNARKRTGYAQGERRAIKTLSIRIDPGLHECIKSRAEANNRSMSGEIEFVLTNSYLTQ